VKLFRVVQPESGQPLKRRSDGHHQLIRLACRHFSARLTLDNQLPKLAEKSRSLLTDQLSDVVGCFVSAEQLIEELEEFQVVTSVFNQPRD
jgi:hypothetical protein